MKQVKTILGALLILVLGVVGLIQLAAPDRSFSSLERRPLAASPTLSLDKWLSGSFARDTEKWLADQFTGRDFWLSLKAQSQASTGQKDNGRVYFADDEYLMEMHPTLDEAKLSRNLDDMIDFYNEYFRGRDDVTASLLLAPTAAGVYRETLPSGAVEADQSAILTGLTAQAAAAGLQTPELLPFLRENASQETLYFRGDHHWTQHGAYQAFLAWLGQPDSQTFDLSTVSETFCGTTLAKASLWTVPPDQIEAYQSPLFDQVELYDEEGVLLRLGVYNPVALDSYDPYEYFIGENRAWLRLETGSEAGRNLLIFKDSYANALVPFLCPYFDSITMVDLRYLSLSMEDLLACGSYSDVLFVYNVVTLADENSTYKLLR